MTDLAFPGYRAFAATPDDPLRAKWASMSIGTMRSIAVAPNLASIGEFNLGINREIKFDDRESFEMSAWQTPQQTLTRGSGDCKDYALLKYSLLMHKAITACVVFGEIRKLGMGELDGNLHHAWCAALVEDRWYALDNNADRPIPVEDYPDWTPKAAMHDQTVTRFVPDQTFTINDTIGGSHAAPL